jgi:hypothetical protein
MDFDVATRAGRREWIGLAVIALPCLLYSVDLTVLNLAVPHISADLTEQHAASVDRGHLRLRAGGVLITMARWEIASDAGASY